MEGLKSLPEHTSEDEQLLLAKYYDSNFQFQHSIDSFDRFLEHDLNICMEARKIALTNSNLGFLRVTRIEQPTYEIGGTVHDLTPEIALLEDRTYAVQVYVVAVVVTTQGEVKSTSPEFFYMRIPIPVYSGYCYYNWIISDTTHIGRKTKIPPEGLIQKTKTPENPGCYFILGGTRNVVLLFEKGRFNQYSVHIDLNSPHRLPYLCLISESPHSTSSTNLYLDLVEDRSLYVGVGLNRFTLAQEVEKEDEESGDGDRDAYVSPEKAQRKKTRQPSTNVLCVAYAVLAAFSKAGTTLSRRYVLKKFTDRLKEIIPREVYSKCYSAFAATLLAYQSLSVEQILEVLYTGTQIIQGAGSGTDGRLLDLWVYFSDQMFPNWRLPEQKFEILVMMTSRLLLCHVGYTKITDRNHWATRSLHNPGPTLMGSYRRLHTKSVATIQGAKEFSKIITAADLARAIQDGPAIKLETGFMNSFKPPNNKALKGGMSKKPQAVAHKAIAIDASPINTDEMRSILTKTKNSAFKDNPSFRNRSVEGSFWKMLCFAMATEDARCGLTKFIALLTLITLEHDPFQVMDVLLKMTFGNPPTTIVKKKYVRGENDLPVTVDSLLIGFTSRETGYDNIIMLKRYGVIPRQSCVVMTPAGVLEIYVDAHRLMIPVVTCEVDDRGVSRPRIHSNPNWKTMSYNELLEKGYIEYMDNYEIENPTITLAQTFASFHNYEVELQKWRQNKAIAIKQIPRDTVYEQNVDREIDSMLKGRPNYAALHPLASFMRTATALTFQNRMQSCRVAYASKHYGQIILDMLDNPYEHSKSYTSMSKTISTLESSLPNLMGVKMAGGNTVTVGLISDALNEEDACFVNRRYIDLGGFRYTRTMIFRDTLEDREQYGRLIVTGVNPYVMRHIGENGIPATGVRVGPGDCILGKYRKEEVDGVIQRSNKSIFLDRDEEGVITEVVTYESVRAKTKAKKLTVSIKVVLYSRLSQGDKLSTKHSQKYIASAIVSPENMPWNEKITLTIGFNPACLPTRMTGGTVMEPLIGMATALGGRLTDLAGHRDYNMADVRQTLLENGYSPEGTQRLYMGTTGRRITAEIFVGSQRVNQLAHIAAEKIQCRAMGKQNKVNRQAEASKYGEARNKGQKVGEPERNQLIKYGASFVVADRMNISCDGVTVVVCKLCSSYASYDKIVKAFSCPKCGFASLGETQSSKFGKFVMPQTARYTHSLLISLGVVPQPKFVDREEYLNKSATNESDLDIAGDVLEADEVPFE